MKSIICIGNATWDQTFTITQDQVQAAKSYAHAFSTSGGGVAATAAVAIADWQEPVFFIGRFGQDAVNEQITAELIAHNVDVRHCLKYEHAQSSIATIILSDNDSSKICVYNDPHMPKDTSSLFNIDLTNISAIVADVTWLEGAKVMLDLARQHGIPTFLRLSFYNDSLVELLDLAEYCVFNHPALLAMTSDINHKRALIKAVRRHGGTSIVTLGQRGCAWFHDGCYGELPAHEVNVVDTTGAGDIFVGILALQLSKQKTFSEAISIANHTASLSCETMGSRQLHVSPKIQELIAHYA